MGKMEGGGGGARRCTVRTATSDGAFEAASKNTTIKLWKTCGGRREATAAGVERGGERYSVV